MTNHPNRKTRYTVLDRDGAVQARGCTVAEAAAVVMRYDGEDFEIRPGKRGSLELGITIASRNFQPGSTAMFWLMSARGLCAEAKIYMLVTKEAHLWRGCRVCTDADYSAEQEAS